MRGAGADLTLRIEALTGTTLDIIGNVRPLKAAEWRDIKTRYEAAIGE